MMKHCGAEKLAFSLVRVSLPFVFCGLCNTALLAQVTINGFARLTETDIPSPGMLRSTNYNGDQYNDIVVISSTSKSAFTIQGKENGGFSTLRKSSLQYTATNVSLVDPTDNTLFIASRSSKRGGIYKIKAGGELQSLEQFTWRGAPSAIASGDVNNDGTLEYYISGAGFEGISQLKKNNSRHSETKIEKLLPFSAITLADCNNDSYLDLVGYNISKQSLSMYYNNTRGELSYTREIYVASRVREIQATDLNLDGFTDIILVYSKGIEIIYGDGPASFNRRKSLFHREQIKELAYGDYNKDGIRDFAFTSESNKGITIAFGTEGDIYTPYSLLETEKIVSILSFYSNYLEGLAIALDGKLLLISRVPSLTQAERLLFPITPNFMMAFPGFNSGLSNLVLLQKDNVGFVIRDNAGLPSVFNSRKLSAEYSSVLFRQGKSEVREFYFWKEGLRSVDKVSLSGKGQTLTHSTLYTKGKIIDVSTTSGIDEKGTVFLILTETNESLSLIGYSRENKITFSNSIPTSSKMLRRKIANSELLYAIEEKNDTLTVQLIPLVGEKQSTKTLHLPRTKFHFLKSVGVTQKGAYRALVFADSSRNSVNLISYTNGRFVQKQQVIKNNEKRITSLVCNEPSSLLLSLGSADKYFVSVKQNELSISEVSNVAKGTTAFCEVREGERFPSTLVVYPKRYGIGVIN